ncbi:MAG: FIST C-terminal domain-containing protein [Chloroflexi bacterium]|nr:FIST C-terminal domain-containing protein [Chloroflexota bacterium]
MSIRVGVGSGKAFDGREAGAIAAREALARGGISDASLVIVFASSRYSQEQVLAGVASVVGDSAVVGCSTAGEITARGSAERSVAVMALAGTDLVFRLCLGEGIAEDAREAGRRVARAVLAGGKPETARALMILPDGLAGNGADIVRGVQDELGAAFPIVGGSAGDDYLFEKTYQLYNRKVLSGAVPGVLFAGKLNLGIGVRHGWQPLGQHRTVTRAEGARLYELDGRPAVSIYEDYFGKDAEELRREPLARMALVYPLGIPGEGANEYLIRDPLRVEEDGSIVCAAEIPQGTPVRLMIGSNDQAVEAARHAASQALEALAGARPKAAIIFNCIARKKLLGRRADEEIRAIREVLGEDVPLIGFYTYGEQAPLGEDIIACEARFHNQTAVILALGVHEGG